eukprot:GHVQ01035288.1.p1 GENE.GHVQ01035288.1~~GHVQ01035288.1.p1  ORF type:complete len:104 (-),score=7.96 GHVQ01035288.1:6-317(-)
MASTGISLDQLLSARETQLDRLHKADDAMLTPTGDLSTVSAPIGVAEMVAAPSLCCLRMWQLSCCLVRSQEVICTCTRMSTEGAYTYLYSYEYRGCLHVLVLV